MSKNSLRLNVRKFWNDWSRMLYIRSSFFQHPIFRTHSFINFPSRNVIINYCWTPFSHKTKQNLLIRNPNSEVWKTLLRPTLCLHVWTHTHELWGIPLIVRKLEANIIGTAGDWPKLRLLSGIWHQTPFKPGMSSGSAASLVKEEEPNFAEAISKTSGKGSLIQGPA